MQKPISIFLAALAVATFIVLNAGCLGVNQAVATPVAVPSPSPVAGETDAQTEAVTPESTVEEADPAPVAPTVQPIEVTYFTPSQQEGPYYTVEKPTDRDNDLTVLDGAAGSPAGEVVEFGGTVYGANGFPIPGAVIEIWQTDASGVYLHPSDPGTAQRDINFQFYGEATTDENGRYQFRTILPGEYEPRPRHIHFKVKLAGQELITSQFYFAGESGGQPEALTIILTPGQDAAGNPLFTGQRDIILDVQP